MKRDKKVICGVALAIGFVFLMTIAISCGGSQTREKPNSQPTREKPNSQPTTSSTMPKSISTTPPQPRAKISGTFIAFSGEDRKIYAVPLDDTGKPTADTNLEPLTGGYDDYPVVSPDGKTIVYEHSDADSREAARAGKPLPCSGLYAIPTTGGEPRRLTPASWMNNSGWNALSEPEPNISWEKRRCMFPSFSPDGKSICFVIEDRGRFSTGFLAEIAAIATLRVDEASEPKVLLTSEQADLFAYTKYSPDGSRIYFSSFCEIKSIPSDGGTPIGITSSEHYDFYDAFDFTKNPEGIVAIKDSPEGGSHGGFTDGITTIVQMDLDGNEICTLFTFSDGLEVLSDRLSVSPDGSLIAFTEFNYPDEVGGPICVLDLTSMKVIEVTRGHDPCFGYFW